MLLTRAPVAGKGIATSPLPLDLHVLGLSLAFILSQDQTLRCIFLFLIFSTSKVVPSALMPDYLSSGFEFVLTLTCFLYPLYRDTRLVLLSSIVMFSRILFCFPLL